SHRLSATERAMFEDGLVWRGAGCDDCNGSGYRGRIGYYELLATTPKMREMITKNASVPEILAAAGPGHVNMRTDGLRKAARGETTVDEVLRATQDVEEG